MRRPRRLFEGHLIRRTKRVLADVEMPDGSRVCAYCPNSGSMSGLDEPGSRVWVSPAGNPNRHLRFVLEIVETAGTMVSINESLTRPVALEAMADGLFPTLSRHLTPEGVEARVNRTLLELSPPPKSELPKRILGIIPVFVKTGAHAVFPERVDTGYTRKLHALSARMEEGLAGTLLFMVFRNDCSALSLSWETDAHFTATVRNAQDKGLDLVACRCRVSPFEVVGEDLMDVLFEIKDVT